MRQSGMDARHGLGLEDVPAGAQSSVMHDRLQTTVDQMLHPLQGDFAFENKFGRTVRAEQRVEQAVRQAWADPVRHAATISVRWSKLVPRLERGTEHRRAESDPGCAHRRCRRLAGAAGSEPGVS